MSFIKKQPALEISGLFFYNFSLTLVFACGNHGKEAGQVLIHPAQKEAP